jgi:hypothetical protein
MSLNGSNRSKRRMKDDKGKSKSDRERERRKNSANGSLAAVAKPKLLEFHSLSSNAKRHV